MREQFAYKANVEVPIDSPLANLLKYKRASQILALAEKAIQAGMLADELKWESEKAQEAIQTPQKETHAQVADNSIDAERQVFLNAQRQRFNS